MSFPARQKIGRYEICSQLGAGGMGEVYLANDTKLDRKVTLKIRFIQEAKAASALNHPNILTIYEIDEIDSEHFIATEFIDGETLRARTEKGPIDAADALEVGIQVTGALSSTHNVGIIHRDDNIMLHSDGINKVLDFGLAKPSRERQTLGTDADSLLPHLAEGLKTRSRARHSARGGQRSRRALPDCQRPSDRSERSETSTRNAVTPVLYFENNCSCALLGDKKASLLLLRRALKADSGPWPTGPERTALSIRYLTMKSFRSY